MITGARPGEPMTLVIGIGNPYRGDDAVGIAVAHRLRRRREAGVTVLENGGDGAMLMEAWKDAAAVILVDAVRSGAAPGTVHRVDALAQRLPGHFLHTSTHAFGAAEAIEMARALGQLPARLLVYGIEGRAFAAGKGLSAEVEQAAQAVVKRIVAESQLGTVSRRAVPSADPRVPCERADGAGGAEAPAPPGACPSGHVM